LDDHEFQTLLQSCTGHLYQIVLVALNTGMRLGEILGLKWENVRPDKIEVKHTKTDEDRSIPINSFLRGLIESLPRTKEYLFVNRHGDRIGSIKTAWWNALRKAEIEDFHFHDLRHTFGSRLARAKVPESVIAMILGHKRTTITSRYINPHWEEMIEAVEVLGVLCHRFVTDNTEGAKEHDHNQSIDMEIDQMN